MFANLITTVSTTPNASPLAAVITTLLDELDYGVILAAEQGCVAYLNRAAQALLHDGGLIAMSDYRLLAERPADRPVLGDALAGAARGLRRLVTLGGPDDRVSVALIPLRAATPFTVLIFGRRRLCERMSLQWFARAHGLTPAESSVLELLSEGRDPREVAQVHEVGMATVRTQVKDIRDKTGASSIRSLMHQVALLPPMVCSLRN